MYTRLPFSSRKTIHDHDTQAHLWPWPDPMTLIYKVDLHIPTEQNTLSGSGFQKFTDWADDATGLIITSGACCGQEDWSVNDTSGDRSGTQCWWWINEIAMYLFTHANMQLFVTNTDITWHNSFHISEKLNILVTDHRLVSDCQVYLFSDAMLSSLN